MIRLPRRRRVSRRGWQLYSHPMARIPHEQFFAHVKDIDAPATWEQLIAEADTTTARGNR